MPLRRSRPPAAPPPTTTITTLTTTSVTAVQAPKRHRWQPRRLAPRVDDCLELSTPAAPLLYSTCLTLGLPLLDAQCYRLCGWRPWWWLVREISHGLCRGPQPLGARDARLCAVRARARAAGVARAVGRRCGRGRAIGEVRGAGRARRRLHVRAGRTPTRPPRWTHCSSMCSSMCSSSGAVCSCGGRIRGLRQGGLSGVRRRRDRRGRHCSCSSTRAGVSAACASSSACRARRSSGSSGSGTVCSHACAGLRLAHVSGAG